MAANPPPEANDEVLAEGLMSESSSMEPLPPTDLAIEAAVERAASICCWVGPSDPLGDTATCALPPAGAFGPPPSTQTISWFFGRLPTASLRSCACWAEAVTAIVAAIPTARLAAASAAPQRARVRGRAR